MDCRHRAGVLGSAGFLTILRPTQIIAASPVSESISERPPARVKSGARLPIAARIIFALAGIYTLVGLLETGFILYDSLTGHQLSALSTPDLGLGIRSWTEHHAMRPGYDIPPTQTNSFGLRSPEVVIPKPPGTYRILLLGDSFTLGFRAAEEDIFARKLEHQLRKEYGTTAIDVINAGVLSYCPLLEFLQYRQHLHILEPDLVILNFDLSAVQDHIDYSRDAVFAADGTPLFVTEPSLRRAPSVLPGLLSLEWLQMHLTAARRRYDASVEGASFVRDLDRYAWTLDNGPDWDKEVKAALAPVADLAKLLNHYGIKFVLATYPQPWQVSPEATPLPPIRAQFGIGLHTVHLNDRPFHKIEAFAEEKGIPFINATASFRAAPNPADLFLPADFHFSPRGHQVYADVLRAYVSDHFSNDLRAAATPVR